VFVSDEEIQYLNKTYREKDSVTDVLSFHYFEDFSNLQKDDIAGELIFCESKILSQAKEY
jgi:probable rRNA maturation factor